MKAVSIREFQLNAKEHLKEMPLLLTRYGRVIAQVIPNGTGEISQEVFDEVYEKVTATETCNHVLKYAFGSPVYCGEKVYKDGKCKKHQEKADL